MKYEEYIGDAAILHYEEPSIPLRIKDVRDTKSAIACMPHWHDDFELVFMLEGNYEYRINDDALILQPGDFLFINTRVLHYNRVISEQDVHALYAIFQPSILTGNTTIAKRFLEPIWKVNPLEYLFFPRNTSQAKECEIWMTKIIEIYHAEPITYHLCVIGYLNCIMHILYREFSTRNPAIQQITPIGEIEKAMISYIYHHFPDKITLEDIAKAGYVNVHTCCNIFKHYVHTSPINYLNTFRLTIASRLLATTNASIQDIALKCGFGSSAYFIRLFKNQYDLTPKQFRKQQRK